jgi:hypothetical protein
MATSLDRRTFLMFSGGAIAATAALLSTDVRRAGATTTEPAWADGDGPFPGQRRRVRNCPDLRGDRNPRHVRPFPGCSSDQRRSAAAGDRLRRRAVRCTPGGGGCKRAVARIGRWRCTGHRGNGPGGTAEADEPATRFSRQRRHCSVGGPRRPTRTCACAAGRFAGRTRTAAHDRELCRGWQGHGRYTWHAHAVRTDGQRGGELRRNADVHDHLAPLPPE